MQQTVEVAWKSLSKHGEELCGDTVKITTMPASTVVVLSDGLGSGVKANILSTLTAQIAGTMFKEEATIEEVIETLVDTLPECRVRRLAYATFSMLRISEGREAFCVEYDSPPLILVRDGELVAMPYRDLEIHGRRVKEATIPLHVGDYMVMVSDGYEHAGVGGLYRLGWGWDNIAIAVRRWCRTGSDAEGLARALDHTARRLYKDKPGDDATVVAMRVRPTVRATVWTGPPSDHGSDAAVTEAFMAREGTRVLCGGTTAQIAARELGRELEVEWVPPRQRRQGRGGRKRGSPPMAKLEGVDLVTEGVVTLGQTVELLRRADSVHDLPGLIDEYGDGAPVRLASILLQADEVELMVGMAINPAQVADLLRGEPMRMIYIRELLPELERRNKRTTVRYV